MMKISIFIGMPIIKSFSAKVAKRFHFGLHNRTLRTTFKQAMMNGSNTSTKIFILQDSKRRKRIDDDIVYLPVKIKRIYNETLQALNAKSQVLAGIGLRALVRRCAKEKSASGSNLHKKIDDLVVKNILTPAGANTCSSQNKKHW